MGGGGGVGGGRRQAIYFSMGGWCRNFSNYMGRWCSTKSKYMVGWSRSFSNSAGGCYCICCVEGGRKNIICQKKKREVLLNLAKRNLRTLQNHRETASFVYTWSSKLGCFRWIFVKTVTQTNSLTAASCSRHYFFWETCILRRIYSMKQCYRGVRLLVKTSTCKNQYQ